MSSDEGLFHREALRRLPRCGKGGLLHQVAARRRLSRPIPGPLLPDRLAPQRLVPQSESLCHRRAPRRPLVGVQRHRASGDEDLRVAIDLPAESHRIAEDLGHLYGRYLEPKESLGRSLPLDAARNRRRPTPTASAEAVDDRRQNGRSPRQTHPELTIKRHVIQLAAAARRGGFCPPWQHAPTPWSSCSGRTTQSRRTGDSTTNFSPTIATWRACSLPCRESRAFTCAGPVPCPSRGTTALTKREFCRRFR